MAITIRPYINAAEANYLMRVLTQPLYRNDKEAISFIAKLSASGIPAPQPRSLEEKLGLELAPIAYNSQPDSTAVASTPSTTAPNAPSFQPQFQPLTLEEVESIPDAELNALFGL